MDHNNECCARCGFNQEVLQLSEYENNREGKVRDFTIAPLAPITDSEYTDNTVGGRRVAWFSDTELQALWVSTQAVSTCDRQWLQSWFCQTASIEEAWWVLSGNPLPGEKMLAGRFVPALGLVRRRSVRPLLSRGLPILFKWRYLKAGTNCVYCIPEIRGFIKRG